MLSLLRAALAALSYRTGPYTRPAHIIFSTHSKVASAAAPFAEPSAALIPLLLAAAAADHFRGQGRDTISLGRGEGTLHARLTQARACV
jgi:hypothetical protein